MTQVRWTQKSPASFNNLVADLFPAIPSLLREDYATVNSRQIIPVNIRESENEFILDVIAPGFDKEDFKIDLDKNTLTISGDQKINNEARGVKILKNEYSFRSFKRSFTISEQVDTEKIAASFKNGVLTLNLPRKVEVKEAAKQISVQ